MSEGTLTPGSAYRAERRRDAHRLCATLAELLAQALRIGDVEAAQRYTEDLERVQRVARDTPEGPAGWKDST